MEKRILNDESIETERELHSKEQVKYATTGITLVALVVTIVVLLILAGITITYVLGDNSIIRKAQEAKNKTEEDIGNESNEIKDLKDLLEESNEPDRTLTINFRDSSNWKLIDENDKKIELYKDEACTQLFKTISMKDGTCKLTGSDVPHKGTYYMKMLRAPDGYNMVTKIRKAEISNLQDVVWNYILPHNIWQMPESGGWVADADEPFGWGERNIHPMGG